MSQRINLNTTPNQFMPILYFSQGDIGRTFEIALTSSDGYSIPIGATVEMVATKPSGFGFTVSGSLTGNVATFVTTETMTSEWGRFPAEIVIKNNGDVIGTANFYLNGERNPHPEGTIDGDASTIIPQLTLLVERVETAASSVLDRQTVTQTLPAGSQASYSFDEETNTQTFGIPQGEAGAGAVDVTASAYSSSKTYAVGDYVIHNDYLYRCTTAITTAEAWTSGHWTQVLLGDEVSDVKSKLNVVSPICSENNLFVEANAITGYLQKSDGTLQASSVAYTSDYIPVKEGDIYIIKSSPNSGSWYNCFFDANKTLVSAIATNQNSGIFPMVYTAPSGAAYLRVTDVLSLISSQVVEHISTLPLGQYPFNESAYIRKCRWESAPEIGVIGKAIKDIKIHKSDPNIVYQLGNVYLNKLGNGGSYIAIFKASDLSSVCVFENAESLSGIHTLTATTTVAAGTYAEITVDFDEVPAGGVNRGFANAIMKPVSVLSERCKVYSDIYHQSDFNDYLYRPFACSRPTSNSTQQKVYDVVKDIKVFGAKKGDELIIRQFGYEWTALDPVRTYITIYKGATKVCEYDNTVSPTTEQTVHFGEFGNSGISADVTIDFSQLSDNFVMSGTPTYNDLGISELCFVPDEETPIILIPDTVYGVVGFETNIYWEEAIKCGNIADYKIMVSGKGENKGNGWSYIPSAAESFTLNVEVRDKTMRLRASKAISIVAKAKAVGSATTIKAIHIGDSMIDNPYHIPDLVDDFDGTNITYQTFGTRNNNTNEGRGGWTSGMYLAASTDPNVPNPFYNSSTQTFDFSYYMTNQGYATPDYVFVFLGTNDIKGTSNVSGMQGGTDVSIKNIGIIVDSIKDYDSDIKVCVCTPANGAYEQYPYGISYGDNRIKQPLHKYGIQMLVEKMMFEFAGREAEGIYVIPTGMALDNVNGMQTTTVSAAARITKQITVQSDPYHPTSEGYHQFADCEFGFIRNQLA